MHTTDGQDALSRRPVVGRARSWFGGRCGDATAMPPMEHPSIRCGGPPRVAPVPARGLAAGLCERVRRSVVQGHWSSAGRRNALLIGAWRHRQGSFQSTGLRAAAAATEGSGPERQRCACPANSTLATQRHRRLSSELARAKVPSSAFTGSGHDRGGRSLPASGRPALSARQVRSAGPIRRRRDLSATLRRLGSSAGVMGRAVLPPPHRRHRPRNPRFPHNHGHRE